MSIVDGGIQSASVSITATNNAIVAAVTGKRIYVLSYILNHSAAGITSAFNDVGNAALEGAWAPAANGTRNEAAAPGEYLFATSPGNALGITQTGAGTVAGRVTYKVAY